MDNAVTLAAVGFAVGALSGMGVGGGSLLIIILTLAADLPQRTAQGVNLFFFLPTAAAAVVVHLKSGNIDRSAALKNGSAGLVSAVIFSVAAQRIEGSLLRRLFALLVLASGLYELFSGASQDNPEE